MSEDSLPPHWQKVHLGDVLDVQGGSQPPKSTFVYKPKKGYIQLLQIRDFGERGVPTFVPLERVTKFCKKDDILIARYGASLGRIVTGMEGAYNVALAKVIDEGGVFERRFVMFLLRTRIFQTPLKMLSRSAQNGFSKGEIANIELPVPPLIEQHAIVSKLEQLFSELDKGIESLKTAQQQLKVYRQSVLKWAFEGKLTAKWRKNQTLPDASELLAQIQREREEKAKESGKKLKPVEPMTKGELDELPELPAGWCWARLGSLGGHIVDGTHHTPEYQDSGIPFISAKDINNGRIDFDRTKFISPREHEELIKRCHPTKGDILLTKSGTIGRVAVVKTDSVFSLFESVAVIPAMRRILSEYLAFMIFFAVDSAFGKKFRKGVAVRHLHLEDIRKLPVPICSPQEQEIAVSQIESRLSLCDNLEQTIAGSIEQSEAIRQSILKTAFEGKILADAELEILRKDPSWEPAEKLLARIRDERVTADATVAKESSATKQKAKRKTK